MRQLLPGLLLPGLLLLAGCGYRWVSPGRGLPEGVRSVQSPLLKNHTAEPGIEAYFTQALREQLLRAGVEVPPTGPAEGELRGEILELRATPTILTRCGNLASYRLTATARLTLLKADRKLSQVVVSAAEDFLPPDAQRCGSAGQLLPPLPVDPVLTAESNRELALRHLAQVLMRDAYDRLASSF